MDQDEVIGRAYEIALDYLKRDKVFFTADELSEKFSFHYGFPIPFARYGFASLNAVFENSDYFERCPGDCFSCVEKKNYVNQYELPPPPKGFYAGDEKRHDSDMSLDSDCEVSVVQAPAEASEQNAIEKPHENADTSTDSDDELRALKLSVSLRDLVKRAQAPDPGKSSSKSKEKKRKRKRSRNSSPERKRAARETHNNNKTSEAPAQKPRNSHRENESVEATGASVAPTINSIVEKVVYYLAKYVDDWVRLDKLETRFGRLGGMTLHDLCALVFGGEATYEKLRDAGSNEFHMYRGQMGWYLKVKKEGEQTTRESSDVSFSRFLKTVEADMMIWPLTDQILRCLRAWDFEEWVPFEKLCEFFGNFHKMTLPEACKKLFGPVDPYPKLFAVSREKFIAELRQGKWFLKRMMRSGVAKPANMELPEKPPRESLKTYSLGLDSNRRASESWRDEQSAYLLPPPPPPPLLLPSSPQPLPPPLPTPPHLHATMSQLGSFQALNMSWRDEPWTSQMMTPSTGNGGPSNFGNPVQPPVRFPQVSPPLYHNPVVPPVPARFPQPLPPLFREPVQAPVPAPFQQDLPRPLPSTAPSFFNTTRPERDPRLTDFAHRIRHILSGMNGRGYLPLLEEAYFQAFGSRMQYDFNCVASGANLYILTEISRGEIVVEERFNNRIHLHLKNFW